MPIIAFNRLFDNKNYLLLFHALWDSWLCVREEAVEIIHIIHNIINQRDTKDKWDWFESIYMCTMNAFEQNDSNYFIHSALLITQYLIMHADKFLSFAQYEKISSEIYKMWEKKDQLVWITVI